MASVTPKHSWIVNLFWAFVIGGAICTLGQALINLYRYLGAGKEDAVLYQIITFLLLLNIINIIQERLDVFITACRSILYIPVINSFFY